MRAQQIQVRSPDSDRAQDRTATAFTIGGVEELPETSFVCVGDVIDVDHQDGFLRCEDASWTVEAYSQLPLTKHSCHKYLVSGVTALKLWMGD